MKKLKLIVLLALTVFAADLRTARAEGPFEKDPAYLPIDKCLDLTAIKPEVDVNLPRFLLQDALSGLTGTNSPLAGAGVDLPELLKDVKLIRVVVIEANKSNRKALDAGIKSLQEKLDSKWTAVVHVPDGNVGIYAMGDTAGESMAGLAVLVNDGNDAVIANVVGKVSLGKLIKLAWSMDKLPKDLMQKLGMVAKAAADVKKPTDGEKKPASDTKPEAK